MTTTATTESRAYFLKMYAHATATTAATVEQFCQIAKEAAGKIPATGSQEYQDSADFFMRKAWTLYVAAEEDARDFERTTCKDEEGQRAQRAVKSDLARMAEVIDDAETYLEQIALF